MTYGAFQRRDRAHRDLAPLCGHRSSRSPIPYTPFCAAALIAGGSLGLMMLYTSQPARLVPPSVTRAESRPPEPLTLVPRAALRRIAASKPRIKLFDPVFDADHTPVTFDETVLLAARFEITPPIEQDVDSPVAAAVEPSIVPPLPLVSELVRDVPLPMPRPVVLAPSTRFALHPPSGATTGSPPDRPSFFDKLFGAKPDPSTALAYAAPDDESIGRGPVARTIAAYGQRAAVYDIAAHTVYLPGGGRLEAHSGLGSRLDDPRSVAEHMRGATPPAVYELTLREQPFHGVRALRLSPIGGGTVYGRAGLLAHTFMLGPRGDSNGCVVFRDYRSFLQAYESGAVNRLVVVASLN